MKYMKFAKELTNGSATYTFTEEEIASVKSGEMLLFSFVVKAPVSTPINITVDVGTVINFKDSSKTMTYYAPVQWSRIYMPITNAGMKSVTVSTEGTVYIAEAKYENRHNATQNDLQLESGMRLLKEFEYTDISDKSLGVGSTIDLVSDGNYIYSIGGGKLTVTDTVNKQIIGTLSGFGALRQIDITDNGDYVVITARQDGVYIVNVKNPASPTIVATYNSIEMATGLYVSENYAFICNRQYGVEVVDISVPESPKHLINIHSGEVQSCVVYNNILYAGVWSECGVYMYDLSKITDDSHITPIAKITTDGKGDGMSIAEIGGKVYLFAATGQHTYGAPTSSPLQNLCYGQGNGMDIYDITDPTSPEWVSTAKIDGRYYYTANDYWETEVGYDEESGKYYAYFVNTYNGLFVFDVTNVEAPVRLAHFYISKPLTSTVPALSHTSRAIITSWDQTKENRGPIGAIVIDGGTIYIAGSDTDLFAFEHPLVFREPKSESKGTSFDNLSDRFYDFKNQLTDGTNSALSEGSFSFYDTDGQIVAIASYGNYIYVAAGAEGVKILDKATLNEIGSIGTVSVGGRVGFANDVKVYGDKLYVAADIAGLRVYDISGEKATAPTFLWDYKASGKIARQITVSPDALFTVVQVNTNTVWIVDNAAHTLKYSRNASGGTLYYHNLSTVIADRYVCFWDHMSYEYWLDFGPAGERYTTPVFVATGTNAIGSFVGGLGMRNGVTEYTKDGVDYALKIQGTSAVYTNDFTSKNGTQIGGIKTSGKPTVCGNYLFVSERIESVVQIYDISDPTAAQLIGTLVLNGNPDVIYTDGTIVYIPLGYQGLLVIDTSTAFNQ